MNEVNTGGVLLTGFVNKVYLTVWALRWPNHRFIHKKKSVGTTGSFDSLSGLLMDLSRTSTSTISNIHFIIQLGCNFF